MTTIQQLIQNVLEDQVILDNAREHYEKKGWHHLADEERDAMQANAVLIRALQRLEAPEDNYTAYDEYVNLMKKGGKI